MRVVINVPDDWEACRGYPTLEELEEIVASGTPLPKGHGRLIDADELYDSLVFPTEQFGKAFKEVLDDAPTIIEADKGGEQE